MASPLPWRLRWHICFGSKSAGTAGGRQARCHRACLVRRADIFQSHGLARELVVFFCVFVAGSFLFNGALFVANAAFNNLGYAFYSTALNWGRSTLGVIPFVWLGQSWFGAKGALAGYGLGVIAFGLFGIWWSFQVVGRLREASPRAAGHD